jgi:lysophospholipase L1-like esterase
LKEIRQVDHMAGQLVFIGDSLTQWFNWQGRFPDYVVVNLGISGETVEGLLARRERIRSQINDPEDVFLMSGINNIANEQLPGINNRKLSFKASCPLTCHG